MEKLQEKAELKQRKKQEKGITLIALVITIIVLLILAGVSIAMLTGQNGILTQAQKADTQTSVAEEKEQIALAYNAAVAKKQSTDVTYSDLNDEFEASEVGATAIGENPITVTFTESQRKYELDANGNITEAGTGSTTPPEETMLAGEVLKVDPSGENAEDKSPYVRYYNGKNEEGLLCRVLYNDETHGLQIITADNGVVPDVTLGYGDDKVIADEFTYDGGATGVDDNFKKAAASYNDVVNNLNERAGEYKDDKGIATDARSLGSIATLKDGKFQKEDTAGMWSGTYDYLTTYKWNGKFKEGDTNYTEDVNQLKTLGLNANSGNTWLASRYVNSDSGDAHFYVRRVYPSGSVSSRTLCDVFSYGNSGSYSSTYGFRPVFLLPSDVVISSGDGSSENPYVIE